MPSVMPVTSRQGTDTVAKVKPVSGAVASPALSPVPSLLLVPNKACGTWIRAGSRIVGVAKIAALHVGSAAVVATAAVAATF